MPKADASSRQSTTPQKGFHSLGWLELCAILALILAAPAFLGRGNAPKRDFDPALGRTLVDSKSDVVFIGDSMLGTRMDGNVLRSKAPGRCEVLPFSGSGSGLWYLFLKNYVASLRRPPSWVVIFYRGSQLTFVNFRLDGRYKHRLETLERESEPVFDRIVDSSHRLPMQRLERVFEAAYPLGRFRESLQEKVQHIALHAVTRNENANALLTAAQSAFDMKNLRNVDTRDDDGGGILTFPAQPFEEQARDSFLPEMLRLARDAKIHLLFFRVKSRPLDDAKLAIESPSEERYQSELKTYIATQGATLIDETRDPDVTLDFYGHGDHVDAAKKSLYTELFWRKFGSMFESDSPKPESR